MIEDAIKGMLLDAGFEDVYTNPQSVMNHPECIVVGKAEGERTERFSDGERLEESLVVHVCCKTYETVRDLACQVEMALRLSFWEPYSDELITINKIDVEPPKYAGRDGSGRYLFVIRIVASVDRSLA